jgi:hypothetical protein
MANKFAPVCPVHIYNEMASRAEETGYLPRQVLLLAHDVIMNEKAYKKCFGKKVWSMTHIIMDNSVVETGRAADADLVLQAAEVVRADSVALPDVVGDGPRSTATTLDAWDEWSSKFTDYQSMVIIQGATLKEWLHSAEQMAYLEPEWIGIPRITEDTIGLEGTHRFHLAAFGRAIFPLAHIHLFGFSDHIHWDLLSAACMLVDSIDSAVPLRMKTSKIFSEEVPPRGDWWEKVEYDSGMIERCKIVEEYIDKLGWGR